MKLLIVISALICVTLGASSFGDNEGVSTSDLLRWKRSNEASVTNMDIRDAILQLLNVIREGSKKLQQHDVEEKKLAEKILRKLQQHSSGGLEKKIDNISTFLLRMKSKIDSLERMVKKQKRGGKPDRHFNELETLAKDSFEILSKLPSYMETTKDAVDKMSKDSEKEWRKMENLLFDEDADGNSTTKKSLAKVLQLTESNIIGASQELKDIVIESGHMAESLFETVNEGYHELSNEIKSLSNVEQVLLDTADSVMDTKRKLEFGVQQIIFKVSELVKLSGGKMDENLKDQFEDVTRVILSNQNEALGNLTKKVEKEIGQVWRQMGIMYGQVSNSIGILEKVKNTTEGYVKNTGKNLGQMEGQVEGLTDSMVAVDSNLNYMLGQLSLVVQEFNQVKTGLGEAMSGLGGELQEIKKYEGAAD